MFALMALGEIIDAHVHVFTTLAFPGRPPFSADALIECMDEPMPIAGEMRRVDRALIMPSARSTLEPGLSFRDQHEVVIDGTRKHPDRLFGMFMFNPYCGVQQGIEELEHLVKEERFRALKLHPTQHAYTPPNAMHMLSPILEAAERLDLGVLIHTGDAPFALPVMMAPLAEAFPRVRFALGHFGNQRMVLAEEAIEVARRHDNVWLETSCAHLQHLKDGIRVLGASKLLFGSDSPYHDMLTHLRPIEALCRPLPIGINLPEADRERIFGSNVKDVFHLN